METNQNLAWERKNEQLTLFFVQSNVEQYTSNEQLDNNVDMLKRFHVQCLLF